jgi:hypothetical protein
LSLLQVLHLFCTDFFHDFILSVVGVPGSKLAPR